MVKMQKSEYHQLEHIRKQVLATMYAPSPRTDTAVTPLRPSSLGHHIFIVDLSILAALSSKMMLPIQINALFPHITLQLGSMVDSSPVNPCI